MSRLGRSQPTNVVVFPSRGTSNEGYGLGTWPVSDSDSGSGDETVSVGTSGSDTGSETDAGGETYLSLPGSAGAYASSPDSAAVSVVGDIDIRVLAALTDWSPAVASVLTAKFSAAGQLSWSFVVNTNGFLQLYVSANGSVTTSGGVAATPGVADGASSWVRVTRRAADGRYQLFTAPASVHDPVTSDWTQYGGDTFDTPHAIFDSTSMIEVGSQLAGTVGPLGGRVYRVQIRNNVMDDGTGVVFDAEFPRQPIGTTSFAESANGATVTVNGAAAIVGPASPLMVGISDADTGAGSDVDGVVVLSDADTGSGTDAADLTAMVADTDTGTGVDGPVVVSTADEDTAAGTDTEDVASLVSDDETGTVSDETGDVETTDPDTGSADDDEAPVTTGGSDGSGSGVDADVLLSTGDHDEATGAETEHAAVADTDTGTGTDSGSLVAVVVESDTGTAVDSATVATFVFGTETALGLDAGTIGIFDTDTGTGVDLSSLSTEQMAVFFDLVSASGEFEVRLVERGTMTVTTSDVSFTPGITGPSFDVSTSGPSFDVEVNESDA